MRHIPFYLLILPLLWSCSDERFDECQLSDGPVKYLFAADIDTAQVETRVAFDPLDHDHDKPGSPGHYHDLSLHWEEGDKVTLKAGSKQYEFTAEALDVDGDPSTEPQIVFTYRGGEVIENAHQSENCNSDHLKNYGPTLTATLTNVNLTDVTGQSWLATGSYKPIRFTPDGSQSDYAYFKIEVSGFKYSIWGGGTLWVYLLREGCADYNDYHEPWAKITFGTAPTNMVKITGSEAPKTNSEKYLWPNLKDQDTSFKLGTQSTKKYSIDGEGYHQPKQRYGSQ